jgi:hypothetical protein
LNPGDGVLCGSEVGGPGSHRARAPRCSVEDADTWERLRELSCDVAQGYVLTRPLPAAELDRWLTDHNTAVANLTR